MSIVPPSNFCRAPNAFSVPKYISSILSTPVGRRQARWLSTSRPSLQTAVAEVKTEDDTPQEQVSNEPAIVAEAHPTIHKHHTEKEPTLRKTNYHRLVASKKYEARLQASLDPSSLAKTLENHRAVNNEYLVRKVVLGQDDAVSDKLDGIGTASRRNAPGKQVVEKQVTSGLGALFENPNDLWFEHLEFGEAEGTGAKTQADKIVSAKKKRQILPSLEYEGRYVAPSMNKIPEELLDVPWATDSSQPTDERRLDTEIRKFWEYIQLTDLERAAHNAVLQQTQELIQELQPNYATETFGSHRTGLLWATSDLDLRLYDPRIPSESEKTKAPRFAYRKKMYSALQQLHAGLSKSPDYILCHLRHARYPLISMQHKESGIDLQIVCSNETAEQRSRVQLYLTEYPDLAPLFAVLKTMLDVRGLLDVYRGGLGSYSLLMMIVASFKLWDKPLTADGRRGLKRVSARYGSFEESSIGAKLSHFLQLYAQFDPHWNLISIEPPGVFRKIEVDEKIPNKELEKMAKYPEVNGRYRIGVIDPSQPYLLCLQDPADPMNDLGRKAYGIKHIQQTMKHLYTSLKSTLGQPPAGRHSVLHAILGPSYAMYHGRRKKMGEYGSKFL